MAKKKFKIDISPIDNSIEENEIVTSESKTEEVLPPAEETTVSEQKKSEIVIEPEILPAPEAADEIIEDSSNMEPADSKEERSELPEISNESASIHEDQPVASVPSIDQLTQNLYEKAQIEQQIREQVVAHAPSVLSAFRISTDISDAIEYIDKKYDSIKISELVDRLLRNSLEMFYAEDFEYAKAHPYSRDPFTGKRLNADGTQKHTKKTKRRRTTKA